MRRTLLRRFLPAAVSAAALTLGGATAGAAPPQGRATGAAIEEPAAYQAQFLCRSGLQPGVKAFRDLVLREYRGTRSVSEVRPCARSRVSEHADGRAWDWGVHVRKKHEKRQARRLLDWLLAPDEFGNDAAMARRLGIMYVIWDARIWRAYTGEWAPYACSGVTACHKDHVHFSFGWAGALKRTSYWTGTVAPVLPPPIPVLDGPGARVTVKVRARTGRAYASHALRGGLLYTLQAKGVWRHGAREHQRADAVCRQTRRGDWRPSTAFRAAGVWRWLPTIDTGGGCNAVDHTYVATLVPPRTDAIGFTISDRRALDNRGAVKVRIRRVL